MPLRIREFPILVEQAKTVEELEVGPSQVARTQETTSETRQQKAPYNKPSLSSPGLRYYNCGGPHLRRNCTKAASSTGGSTDHVKCYKCGALCETVSQQEGNWRDTTAAKIAEGVN